MRVQNQNGEKNQAELVGGGFAFLINAAIAPKMDGKRTVSFFLVRHCIPIGKEGMFGIKRCGFFLHENEMHSRVSYYICPHFVKD
jgi:hypothetical protein